MHWLKQEILRNNSGGDCDIEGFHDMQTQWLEFRLHELFGMWSLCCNAFAFPVTLELSLPLQVLLNNGNRSAGCRSWCRGTANTILSLRVALQTGSPVFPTAEHPIMAGAFQLHFWSTFICVCDLQDWPVSWINAEAAGMRGDWLQKSFLITLKCVWTPPLVPSRAALCRAVPQPRAKHIWREVLLSICGDARKWHPARTTPLKIHSWGTSQTSALNWVSPWNCYRMSLKTQKEQVCIYYGWFFL